MLKPQKTDFYPFYDPYRNGDVFGYGYKLCISLSFGAIYSLLQYYSLPDKMVFFSEDCWILGIIISTSLFALYVATDIFRNNLIIMKGIEGKHVVATKVVDDWLSDKWFLLAGLAFAVSNTTIGHLLGVPSEFYDATLSLLMVYSGFFLAGFTSGMGLLAITAVIILYVRFAPSLQYSLDANNSDGNGGIKELGDSLWLFGGLIGAVGILVSIYMFGVSWTYMYKPYVQLLFLFWLSLPFILAVSIVLIPGLAVRRQVSYYKAYKANQLKKEKVKIYSSYKQFESKEDDAIISEKKELGEKLERIQNELEKLKKMRNSHIDGKRSD